MRTITNNSTFKDYTCVCEWPEDCFVQGGDDGVVVSKKGNYQTAYFEAFPKNPDCFIRGEGKTMEDAEREAYDKLVRYSSCEHEFEKAKNYSNGMGKCKHCGMMKVVFEPDYTCIECGKHEIAVNIRAKYKTGDNDCLCEECSSKRENFHYIDDRSMETLCNYKNGILLIYPVMDKKTFESLLEKPKTLEAFYKILDEDSNQYLCERMKRLLNPTEKDIFERNISTFDELYDYFYNNYMNRWVERGFNDKKREKKR